MAVLATFTSRAGISPASALAERILGEKSSGIEFRELTSTADETFCVYGENGRVIIEGSTVPAMAMGLNWYLRYVCNTEVSWNPSDRIAVPASLPVPEKEFRSSSRAEKRFFLNYCTFGYSMPWWGWKEWERLIDWMALNGINCPLAITGQESVWYRIWTEMGISDMETRSYFTGPAHLPWHRMQNIDCWQGPLPESWISGQESLQKRIVERERELGMKPVLPAFSGHVPAALKRLYPEADIRSLGEWAGFPEEYHCCFLDPMDPLFGEIQKKFLAIQDMLYGSDHIYGIDLFNEVTPPSWDPDYLARVGRQVYSSLRDADEEAVWLQMTWMFYFNREEWTSGRIQSYITSYPPEHSILLDYYCDCQEVWKMTSSFHGVPFIWCYLGNFGGNSMLRGSLAQVNERIENVFDNAPGNLIGLGATMEGFDCNPFMYEFVFEKAWDYSRDISQDGYASHMAQLRSGGTAESAEAWRILLEKVYVGTGHRSVMTRRPMPGIMKMPADENNGYCNEDLGKVVRLLLDNPSDRPSAKFDIVNFTRQYLTNMFDQHVFDYQEAFHSGDIGRMRSLRKRMECIFTDIDRLLGCEPSFLLGRWISQARSWGSGRAGKKYYESNARNLITTWGDRASSLNDYASRDWAGLAGSYYRERWEMYFDEVEAAVANGHTFDTEAWTSRISDYEKAWWKDCKGTFSSKAKGNPWKEAGRILSKYPMP